MPLAQAAEMRRLLVAVARLDLARDVHRTKTRLGFVLDVFDREVAVRARIPLEEHADDREAQLVVEELVHLTCHAFVVEGERDRLRGDRRLVLRDQASAGAVARRTPGPRADRP